MRISRILLTVAGLFLLTNATIPLVVARQGTDKQAVTSFITTGRLSPEIYLSGGTPASNEERPEIAYNRTDREYMIVWQNNRPVTKDIYARRVSQNGELLSWFAVSDPSVDCLHPSLAYNSINHEYLVVWSQYNTSQTRWEIYGRIIPWNAPGTNSPFIIAGWSSMNLEFPAVSYNIYRNEYMVVWQTSLVSTGQLLGIGRRRLSSTGSNLSNADYITGEGTTNQGSPDIAYNVAIDGYMVVWVEPGASNVNVYASRLTWEGALIGSKFAVEPSTLEQQNPAITTNEQDIFMVVWQTYAAPDWDIYGKQINSGTGVPFPTQYLIAIKLDVHETTPDIVANGQTGEYLFVWEESSPSGIAISGLRWIPTSTGYVFEVAPGGFGDNQDPVAALGNPGYMIAYEWRSWTPGSDSDIFGRLFWPEVVYLPVVLR